MMCTQGRHQPYPSSTPGSVCNITFTVGVSGCNNNFVNSLIVRDNFSFQNRGSWQWGDRLRHRVGVVT
ncbi:uncharacterized protein RNJ42_02284 [Nakaseomyces bracarensis]|uniref:uncharacterized protein n=1 Tax=Nakaseomyces bracarensis TaxID=273131 RepID=UPI003871AF47